MGCESRFALIIVATIPKWTDSISNVEKYSLCLDGYNNDGSCILEGKVTILLVLAKLHILLLRDVSTITSLILFIW